MGITIKGKARRRPGRPPKKSLLSKIYLQPHSTPLKPQVPLPESEMDVWFQSGPFSALPQGATPAEVTADLKLVRAVIDEFTNILLDSTVAVVPSHILSPSPRSSKLSGSFKKNATVSIKVPSLSASKASSRCSSRVKIQASISEPTSFSEPLTPESFYGEDTSLREAMCNEEKRLMDTIVPFVSNQLHATEVERLSRLKNRGASSSSSSSSSSSGIGKQFRPRVLR